MTPTSEPPAHALAAVTHPDPYPWYATLVAVRPFHHDAHLNLWIAASAEAVRAVLHSGACHVRPPAEPIPKHLGDGAAAQVFGRLLRMRDDAQQQAAKQILLQHLGKLSPADVAVAADRVVSALHDEGCHLDDMLFALPVRVVAALLGIPPAHQAEAAHCTGDYVRCLLPQATPEQIARGNRAAETLRELLRVHGRLLPADDEAMLANALGLLMQSHDATAGLLGNALVALQRQPELRRMLRNDPALLPGFVQEVMRFDPPVQNTRRFVARDCRIQGHDLRRGETILLLLAAASRDPAAYDEPHGFRIDRPQQPPIGFGQGRHACAGPDIATAIAAAGIQYWVNHDLAIPQAIGYRPSANARIPYFATR